MAPLVRPSSGSALGANLDDALSTHRAQVSLKLQVDAICGFSRSKNDAFVHSLYNTDCHPLIGMASSFKAYQHTYFASSGGHAVNAIYNGWVYSATHLFPGMDILRYQGIEGSEIAQHLYGVPQVANRTGRGDTPMPNIREFLSLRPSRRRSLKRGIL